MSWFGKWQCGRGHHKTRPDRFENGSIFFHCIRCGGEGHYEVPYKWGSCPKKPSCYSWGEYVLDNGTLKGNKTDGCGTCPLKWACGHAVSMRIGWALHPPLKQAVKAIESEMVV
jgi:hypothetical protein